MNMQTKLNRTCGQALIKLLESYGVDTVFGIPGVHTLELYRGLAGSRIRHVLTRHEQGAGFMADGYARVSGTPGVCFTITGPGVTNVATPVGQAHADSIPMLVISSVNPVKSLGKGRGELHETKDQRGIMAPITAFSATAMKADEVPGLIARAFGIFHSERPRPVFIEIPLDVLAEPIEDGWPAESVHLAPRPAPHAESVRVATSLLCEAEKLVIIAGGGAVDAGKELQKLAERLNAPVFTTVAGKGLLPAGHSLCAGSTLCVTPVWEYLARADVVLAVGTELAETDMWREKLPIEGRLIRIDIDPVKMNDLYPADVPIVADALETLKALVVSTQDAKPVERASTAEEVASLKAEIRRGLAPLQVKHAKVLEVLHRTLPANTFIAADMTQIAYTGNYLFDVESTRSWLHPTGYGTLGYALPAAIGGVIADSDRPALVLAGDGGILYTIQELATATEELRSPLVVLLWNNDSLGQIRDDMVEQGIETVAVNPRNPDYLKVADGFGCRSFSPGSLNELQSALIDAFAFSGVTLIEMKESRVDA